MCKQCSPGHSSGGYENVWRRQADTKIVHVIERAVLADDGTGRTQYKVACEASAVHLTATTFV